MVYTCRYNSPLGKILLAADEIGLTGLWFEGEKYFADNLPEEYKAQETPVLSETKHWLDIYFTGKDPDFFRHCIRWDLYFDSLYGISSCRFLTDRPQLMEKLRIGLPENRDFPKCLHRQLAVLLDIMKFRLSFPATV